MWLTGRVQESRVQARVREGLNMYAEALAKSDLFAGLGPEAIEWVASKLITVSVPDGDVFLREGDAAQALYIVSAGAFSAHVTSEHDGQQIRLRTMGLGEYFGEMGLLTDMPHSATIRAEGPGQVLKLPRVAFHQLLREHPAIAVPILATLSRRLQTVTVDMAEAKRISRELLQINQHLEIASERLKESSSLKSEFGSHVSHELRTPLASMRLSIDNLLDGVIQPLDPRLHQYLVRLKDNTDRLNRLITDLLDLSRLEAGRIELHRSAIRLNYIFDQAVESIRTLVDSKGLTISIDGVIPEQPVWADPDKVHQILVNLIGNATKFTPAPGSITLSANLSKSSPTFMEIAVQDSGEGVPESDRDAIFDKFYQVQRRGPKVPGAGLGLAISKTLVEMHGGRIWVDSTVCHGCRFVFTLPSVDETVL